MTSEEQHQYDLLAQSLPRMGNSSLAQPARMRPRTKQRLSFQEIWEAGAPYPEEGLLLGLAEDGLPVLLNLKTPAIGPLLISGAERSGLRRFLYALARGVNLLHPAHRVQFGLISPTLSCWQGLENLPNNSGIFSVFHRQADDLIMALTEWAYYQRRAPGRQFTLLLIDGLENISKLDEEARLNLHWLLKHGPAYEVWPIVTLQDDHRQQVPFAWLKNFKARCYGYSLQGGAPAALQSRLSPQDEFLLDEGGYWLKFRIPS